MGNNRSTNSDIAGFENRYGPEERQYFIDFLDKTWPLFEEVRKSGGNVSYILDVLSLIHDEERCDQYRQQGMFISYPWEDSKAKAVLTDESFYRIGKYNKDRLIEVNVDKVPKCLCDKLREMEQASMQIRANSLSVEGKVTTTHTLETSYNNEKYVLTSSHTTFLYSLTLKTRKKPRKGRRGEPQSSTTMYILYRYFKGLRLRGIYEKIADLVNGASFHFFKAGTGMSLEPENIRKRIQWAKKQEAIGEYVLKYEDQWEKRIENNKTNEGGH